MSPRNPRPRHPILAGRRGGVVFVALTVTTVALLGAGVAAAAWTSTGSGSATAVAGAALAPTTTAVPGSAFTAGLLYPGLTGTVKLTVNNPNPYPVRVVSVAGTGPATAAGGLGSCAVSGVTLTTTAPAGGNAIAAGGSLTLTLPGAAAMSNASDSGCQNAVFTIPVTVTVESG